MNSNGKNGAKSSHLVVLLLVVGLMAFSSAMKDLSQLHQFALDAGSLIASRSTRAAPVADQLNVIKVETCELNKSLSQSVPTVELPWLENVAEEETIEVKEIEPPHVAERPRRNRLQIVRPGRVSRVDFDQVQLEVRVPNVNDAETDVIIPSEFPQFSFKTKTRKHNVIRISPRDREMLLKTVNRSINLRIAS